VVRGTRRPRPERPTGTLRLLFAGLCLAISTSPIAHQDVVGLLIQDMPANERWQVHLVPGPKAKNGQRTVTVAGYVQPRVARLAPDVSGPDDLIIVERLDPMATATPGRPANSLHRINRIGKSDLMVLRPGDISAGALKTVSLFAPADAEPALPRTAFLLPLPNSIAIAEASAKSSGKSSKTAKTSKSTKGKKEEVPAPVAIAYAAAEPEEDKVKAPFDAVIGNPTQPAGTKILIENPGPHHAWVNFAIPASARSAGEQKCLATAIYFEARGEPEKGQLAVAQIVMNRMKNPAYPSTICGVVYQNKNKRNRCQFSFACDGRTDRITDMKSWATAQALAKKVVEDEPSATFLAEVGASTHYHATYVRPRWARHMKQMQKIGRHIFYRTYGGGWS
jgi:spore germination cell wall hydrolase CwlJ-like protein